MARFDFKNNVKVMPSITPVAAGTTGTGQTGLVVDTRGYEGVTVVYSYGAITATAATFTATLLEGDVTGTMTSVADADLIGTEAAAGLAAAVRVDGSTEKVALPLGYRGNKRYVQAKIVNTATAGTPVAANVLLPSPNIAPVT